MGGSVKIWYVLGMGDKELTKVMVNPFLNDFMKTYPLKTDARTRRKIKQIMVDDVYSNFNINPHRALIDITKRDIAKLRKRGKSKTAQKELKQAKFNLENYKKDRKELLEGIIKGF